MIYGPFKARHMGTVLFTATFSWSELLPQAWFPIHPSLLVALLLKWTIPTMMRGRAFYLTFFSGTCCAMQNPPWNRTNQLSLILSLNTYFAATNYVLTLLRRGVL